MIQLFALGQFIKGSTTHYDYVCADSVKGEVASVGLSTGVPTIFGILTTDKMNKQLKRAGKLKLVTKDMMLHARH